ncbi:hypothetical protein [Streptomyces tubercidicus]|uniref:hypothetical protein n=1 Tax=Streptomyces tubercidicus TaxID=47759 RepID=UPI00369E1348
MAALDYMTGKSLDLGSVPQSMQLALLTAAPPVNPTMGQISEVASTGYTRQNCAFSKATNTVPGQPAQIANSGNILYGPFTDVNGLTYPATHCALIGAGIPLSTTSLFETNTAEMDTDASGWTSLLNATLAASSTQAKTPVNSLRVTMPATGDSQVVNTSYYTVSPYITYKGDGWVYSGTAGVQSRIDLAFYDGSNTQVGYTTTSYTTLSASTWTYLNVSSMAPSSAVSARAILRTTATATNQIVYYDTLGLTPTQEQLVLMTWQFDAMGQAAQNESLQVSAGALTMSLG